MRRLSVWDGVPDADVLKAKLATARSDTADVMARSEALSYLNGAAKVLSKLEKRQALAEYLQAQIRKLRQRVNY